MTPTVSVCVSTFGRATRLDRLLAALARQDLGGTLEVVVYDDASTDDTAAVLARWQQSGRLALTVLHGEVNRGPAYGRNAAWQAAHGELVLFTDDDCQPARGWAGAHLAACAPGRVTVGRTGPDPAQADVDGPFSRTLRVEDATHFQTCNVGYPRALLEQLGGFDHRYRRAAGEDTDLGLRALEAGAEPVFVPAALVHHDVRPSSWWAALQETAKWVDIPLFAARHPATAGTVLHSHRWWRRTHPVAVLAAAGVVGALRHPVALAAVVPWVRLRTGDAPVNARRRHWPWVLPAQLVIDLAEVATLARGSARHRRLLL
ncbi:MAG: glycosyl transferase family 2 [Frankiales bacterium]|nr:glycosyl transferase family 2 [Frankiales bacterium]